jgi:hypothetical protein
MKRHLSRRDFVKASVLGSAAIPLVLRGQAADSEPKRPTADTSGDKGLPKGRIGNLGVTRLIMGGNLIAGYAHARQLAYVSTLMRQYNTPAKIRRTIELGEQHGITAIESWAMDDNSQLFDHWKSGGKIQWIAQVRLGQMWGNEGGYSQIDKAINEGAVAIHLTGDAAESLLDNGQFDRVGEAVQYIQNHKRPAGVAAHDLRVILECEKRKFNVDFYQKTLHPADYFGGPKPGDPDRVGKFDNSWCSDAQAVIDVFAKITKPWIAFKVLAAGGVLPRAGFPFAVNGGADFILVGMFDWQVEENVKLAQRVFRVASGPSSKRTRPWYGGNGTT